MGNTYTYKYGKNLYVNLTNRCSNDCEFCVRNNGGITDESLWLDSEPSAADIIDEIHQFGGFDEAVFCGYGESTYRLDEILLVASYIKTLNKPIRLDTNGLGNALNGFDITPKLVGLIDTVSISLNASCAENYNRLCKPAIADAYPQMLDFAKKCVEHKIDTVMTVVDVIPSVEIEKCREICNGLGAKFRVREYIKG